MFRFFERRIDPYPKTAATRPPEGLFAFLLHYSRPVLPWLLLMSGLTAIISVLEVTFFSFLGTLVDWLASADRATFFADYGDRLKAMALLIVVAYPVAVLAQSLLTHQVIFGNYPMRSRWMAHRYLLNQSLAFFQEEFAGRISQKVMQTALAIRESVTKVLDVFVYVGVYFTGAVVLMGQADPRMMVPLMLWLAGYLGLLVYFVPKLRQVAMAQADARALMTGRIVDSYTNIQTLKLFAHTEREQQYARESMDGFMQTVYRQMRWVTGLTVSLQSLNAALLAATGAMAVWAWHSAAMSLGAIAVAVGLVMRIRGMSDWILWEVASLFENIGTVQDGINTLSQPLAITDAPDAPALKVPEGEIRFEQLRFHYGRGSGVIDAFSLAIRPGEKVGLVGRSGAGKSTLVNLLLRFYDLEGGRILIDGQDIASVTQASLRQQIGNVEVQIQERELQLQALLDNARPNQAKVEGARGDIRRLRGLLERLQSDMTQASEGENSLAQLSSEIQMAQADLATRDLMLQEALTSLSQTRREANAQVRYLQTAVAPVPSQDPSYPRKFENTILAFLIFGGIYLLISLTASILREQVSS